MAKSIEKGFARYGTTLNVYHHPQGSTRVSLGFVEQQLAGICNCNADVIEDFDKNEVRVKPVTIYGCKGRLMTHESGGPGGQMQFTSTIFKNSYGAKVLFKKGGKELIIRPA